MTPSPPEDAIPAPRWKPLDALQRRVLGVLIEKAKTTPAGYPMSVNAIVVGCNQKNNRDPVTSYDDFDVEKALTELQALGVVKEIDWLGRVAKYKHLAYEWLGVRPVELAVLGELLLRGAQALGELRARAARMEPIADLTALKPIVDGLIERKLMIALTSPGRGQIVTHNLYPPGEIPRPGEVHGEHPAHTATEMSDPVDHAPKHFPGVPYEYAAVAPTGSLVFTAGACPLDAEGKVTAPGDFDAQTRLALRNLFTALATFGASPQSVLKTTVYVASASRSDLVRVWDVVANAFAPARPPSTLLGVSVLGYPDQLVEIEAIAVAHSPHMGGTRP